MTSNVVTNAAENALAGLLTTAFVGTVAEAKVFVADSNTAKVPQPYVVVDSSAAEEEISPACGIYKIELSVQFYSHVVETSAAERDEVCTAINNVAYTACAAALSAAADFHCYGFVPNAGTMSIDAEQKSYIYTVHFTAHCMARDNA